ncbi:MAG: NERD domain-containing protein [Mycoplasmoidaceae bacterium]|nr:NERD domain-containing protein [Mycoplasmoidaceae bacterium]
MSTGAIIGIVFGIIAFIVLVAFLARLASPKAKGDRGEAFIANILQQYVNEVGGYLINDVILPYGNRTTQIDHIVFAPAGVFVVETKN